MTERSSTIIRCNNLWPVPGVDHRCRQPSGHDGPCTSDLAALLDVAEAAQRLRANAGGLAVANSGASQMVPLLYWQELCACLDGAFPQVSSEGEL